MNNQNMNATQWSQHQQQESASTCSPLHSPSNRRRVSYIYELPYNVRKCLCDLLDADNSWKQLGGEYMSLSDTQLTLISHALYRGASPTNDLLARWESTNAKVSQLYKYLAFMGHQRAMFLLKPYVDDKLKALCLEEDDRCVGAEAGYDFNNSDYKNKNNSNNDNTNDNKCFDGKEVKFAYYVTSPSSSSSSIDEKKILNNNLNCHDSKKTNACKNNINVVAEDKNIIGAEYKFKVKQNESQIESLKADFDEMEVPYKELMLATDDFSNDRVLGSGGFGIVYKGEWKGTNVAVKRLKGCDNMSQAITELKVLNRYRIDNILPIYGVSLDGPEPCLLYQYMPNGSLEDRLLCKNKTKPLSWLQRINIGEGIARALNYLHTLKGNPFVHGDVKSANVLLDQLLEPKLGDFGLARQVFSGAGLYTHCTVSAVHGTSVYLPPEYLRHKILSPAVDVYSYGIVMLEMATGRRAYDGKQKKLLCDMVDDEIKAAEKKQPIDYSNLMDVKMLDAMQSGNWFDTLLKLGRDCAQKIKKKRPPMIQVLEYYNQSKTRDRIRRLSAEAHLNNDANSIPASNVKTPLELQLWYDLVRKAGGAQSETVCPTVGTTNNDRNNLTDEQSIEQHIHDHDNTDDCELNNSNSSIKVCNRNVSNNESQTENANCNNNNENDMSSPFFPLLTELGFNISDNNNDNNDFH